MYKLLIHLFLLLVLILSTGGCWFGNSGVQHHPVTEICCNRPWVVRVMYTKDPHDWRFSLTKECSTFAVHVCDSSGGEFRVVPMVIGHKEPEIGRAYLEAYMPAIPCQISIEYLYYY